MNSVVYRLKPKEPIPFLLVGEMVCYRGAGYSERVWHLNIASEKVGLHDKLDILKQLNRL